MNILHLEVDARLGQCVFEALLGLILSVCKKEVLGYRKRTRFLPAHAFGIGKPPFAATTATTAAIMQTFSIVVALFSLQDNSRKDYDCVRKRKGNSLQEQFYVPRRQGHVGAKIARWGFVS